MEKRRFRFLKKLSEGTFGKVYLAEIITDSKFSKVVAIKLLHAKWADHDEIIKRSRDEARVLGRLLIHPRALPIWQQFRSYLPRACLVAVVCVQAALKSRLQLFVINARSIHPP